MIYLTYENFRRLDAITRIQAGKPLCVIDVESYKQEFPDRTLEYGSVGKFNGQVMNVPTSTGTLGVEHMPEVPCIVNCIDVEKFVACGMPWIDASKIPPELIFDFIVHHEIAHIRNGDLEFVHHMVKRGAFTEADHFYNTGNAAVIKAMHEYLADRYAWSKIFPGVDMPAPSTCGGGFIRNDKRGCCQHPKGLQKE